MNRRRFLSDSLVPLVAGALAPRVFVVAASGTAQHLAADVATAV
jgi:hypothetical protein